MYVCDYISNLDLLAKTFYAWIQLRNIATVEKVNNLEKAKAYYEKKLMKKVFEAWLFLRVRISYYWQVCIYPVPALLWLHICNSILPNTTTYCREHEFNATCSYSLWRLGHTCQLQDQPHYSCSMPRRSVSAASVPCNTVACNWGSHCIMDVGFPSVAQRYLSWLNEQLLGVKHVEDISDSLADGVLMIEALVVGTPHKVFLSHYIQL